MADFQEDNFEQKLLALKDTQDSIQSLSMWCLKHSQQHKKVVSCWLHVLKKVKVEQRVTLFYLANDVIQYSKRKNYPFVESWATALQKATPLVRDDKVKHKILRLFKIWDERNIYDETFLTDLSGLLTAHTKKSSQLSTAELVQEFQPSCLFSKIRKCKALEEDTDLKLKIVKECSIPVSDPDALQVVVKDRRNGDDLMQDIEDGIVKLEAYTKALELEIKERIEVINVLEVSEQFYDTQRGEAKVVCNAYRNFGNRIKTLKRKLEELLPTLPSPVPSPDINAPSPSSESDLDIPDENKTDFVTAMNHVNENQNQLSRSVSQNHGRSNLNSVVYNSNATNNYDEYSHQRHMNAAPIGYYKNNSQLESESPASPTERNMSSDSFLYHSEGNPIEVINTSSSDSHSGFNASGFLQNIMAANSVSSPVPVPPVPAKIPGLESPTENARDVFCFMEAKAKTADDGAPIMWGDKPLTKYQSWPSPDITWTNSQETPVSPPAFEKESFSNPVEYVDTNHGVDSNRFLFSNEPHQQQQQLESSHISHAVTVDHHRMNHISKSASDKISTIPLPKRDVGDHLQSACSLPNRNLISLTESPSSINDSWKSNDMDYRGMPMPPTPPVGLTGLKVQQDNNESVDMELSDDEADTKGEDRSISSRHRKSSFREDDSISSQTQNTAVGACVAQGTQLLPPPNPWDMMNVSRMDGVNGGGTAASKPLDIDFSKLMGNFTNPPPSIDPATQPGPSSSQLTDFVRFPMPPPPSQAFGDIRFPQPPMMSMPPPPPPTDTLFHSRQDFGPPPCPPSANLSNRMHPPNFGPRPFGFMPNPMFVNNSIAPPVVTTPTKEYSQQTTYVQSSSTGGEQLYLNNIEPLIKSRQFDKRAPDISGGVAGSITGGTVSFDGSHDFSLNKSLRSNLKEISLSDVLERSMTQSQKEDETNDPLSMQTGTGASVNDNDLFGVDDAIDSGGTSRDDGVDDLYNNMDESNNELGNNLSIPDKELSIGASTVVVDKTTVSKPSPTDFMFVQNNFVVYDERENSGNASGSETRTPTKPKTPFQAIVPKVTKPIMAPPNFIEDEERSPWPLMPVIDLSDEANERLADDGSGGCGYTNNDMGQQLDRTNGNSGSFLRPMNNDYRPRFFGGGDRRFPSPGQQLPMRHGGDVRVRGRFSSPRADFRPRGFQMTPNQDQMRRMPRASSPFQRSPGGVNFQNSPRIFKSPRPNRPFRRGW